MKPIAQQEDNESRRLWKEVTAGLKFNDIDKATKAKAMIEQRQRDEAKERNLSNLKWENKVRSVIVKVLIITEFSFF